MEQGYRARKLYEHIWSIEDGNVRVFLIPGRDKALLVDTGFGKGDLKAFVKTLTDLPVMVVNTHADGDHTGGNPQFDEVYMHPSDFNRYEAFSRREGSPIGEKELRAALPVWDGCVIDLGDIALKVLHIPGHTPGSIALLDERNRILIGGDSIQSKAILMGGDGRNLYAFKASLNRLAERNAFDTALASHGEVFVAAEVIPHLTALADAVIEGRIDGVEQPDLHFKLYDGGTAKFLI